MNGQRERRAAGNSLQSPRQDKEVGGMVNVWA